MIIASSKTLLLSVCTLLFGVVVLAQEKPFLWQPEVDLNYQLDAHWNFNFQTSFRSTWDFELQTFDTEIQGNHIQFSGRVNYRNDFDHHIGIGFMYRINRLGGRPNLNEYRLTETYSIDNRYPTFRIGHRFMADQRFFPNRTVWRFRYRPSIDFPWNGDRVDPGEFYSIFSTEALLSVSEDRKPLWDQRFTAVVGNKIGQNTNLQLGLEYRTEGYNIGLLQRFFMYTRLIYSIR
jgi:hypothetical protein